MESALAGLVLDSSVPTAAQTIKNVQQIVGEVPVVLSSMTVAEVGHGIYRAHSQATRDRRRAFLDELKATITIHPVTEVTAEIIARIGGEQAAFGVNLPLADLVIGACAIELGYAIATSNARDFARIPGLALVAL
jgi:tRNA(fMet)-specific endonuclease VapC